MDNSIHNPKKTPSPRSAQYPPHTVGSQPMTPVTPGMNRRQRRAHLQAGAAVAAPADATASASSEQAAASPQSQETPRLNRRQRRAHLQPRAASFTPASSKPLAATAVPFTPGAPVHNTPSAPTQHFNPTTPAFTPSRMPGSTSYFAPRAPRTHLARSVTHHYQHQQGPTYSPVPGRGAMTGPMPHMMAWKMATPATPAYTAELKCQLIVHYHTCGCRTKPTHICNRSQCAHHTPTQVSVAFLPFPCQAKWTGNSSNATGGHGPACHGPDPSATSYTRDMGEATSNLVKQGTLHLNGDIVGIDDLVEAVPEGVTLDAWVHALKRTCEERGEEKGVVAILSNGQDKKVGAGETLILEKPRPNLKKVTMMKDASSQTSSTEAKSAGTQYEPAQNKSTATQSGPAQMESVGIQSESAGIKSTGTQPEPAQTKSTGTQFQPPPIKSYGTQTITEPLPEPTRLPRSPRANKFVFILPVNTRPKCVPQLDEKLAKAKASREKFLTAYFARKQQKSPVHKAFLK